MHAAMMTENPPKLCEVCDADRRKGGGGCTNGRCTDCHRKYCTPGGETSPGHGRGRPPAILLAEGDGISFWRLFGGQVYRARTGEGMDISDYPLGRRWECTIEHWRRFRSNYAWAEDVLHDHR